MTAVHLTKLRAQVDQLIWHFTRPLEFQKGLHYLFELYADGAFHSGESVQAASLIPSYHVPILVMQQLQQDLNRQCRENPTAALALADVLWKDPYLEPRRLAVFILGQTPLKPIEAVVEHIRSWCTPKTDLHLQDEIFKSGSTRLRHEKPGLWLDIIKDWLSASRSVEQRLGLRALTALLQDKEFEDLPAAFALVSPLMINAPEGIQKELINALQALVDCSPVETAFFLGQIVSTTISPVPARLARRLLPGFSSELQANLRKALLSRG
jgi:hypothetical protein